MAACYFPREHRCPEALKCLSARWLYNKHNLQKSSKWPPDVFKKGKQCETMSGPNRPAADIGSIGGVIFQIGQILCAYYAYFGTHGLLKLVRR